MNIYLISQYMYSGPAIYNFAVVVAENEEIARHIHPDTGCRIDFNNKQQCSDWCDNPNDVSVILLGTANYDVEPGVIVAS